jgi:hypothetical protein
MPHLQVIIDEMSQVAGGATEAISELVDKTRKLKIKNRESRLYLPLLIN